MELPPREPPVRREPDSTTKVSVVFYRWDHSPFNVQGIRNAHQALSTYFGATEGERVLFLEAATRTQSGAEKSKDFAREHGGYLNALIARDLKRENGRDPLPFAIARRKSEIETLGIEGAVENKLIPIRSAMMYTMQQMFDELGGDYPFRLEYETHEKSSADKLASSAKEFHALSQQGYQAWEYGDFTQAVAYYKKADELSGQLANRDMEVVDPLKGQVKRLLKNPKGGVIFILLGAAHEPVIPAVQRKLGSNTPVTFEIIGNNPSIEESVALKARTGENLTEEEVARAAFAYHGINKVSEKLIAAGKTSPLMTRFQDISDSINSVAASLSIAEIETTCKGKKTQDVIINHPSAGIIRDVLAA